MDLVRAPHHRGVRKSRPAFRSTVRDPHACRTTRRVVGGCSFHTARASSTASESARKRAASLIDRRVPLASGVFVEPLSPAGGADVGEDSQRAPRRARDSSAWAGEGFASPADRFSGFIGPKPPFAVPRFRSIVAVAPLQPPSVVVQPSPRKNRADTARGTPPGPVRPQRQQRSVRAVRERLGRTC
jgi:hypothetical protein